MEDTHTIEIAQGYPISDRSLTRVKIPIWVVSGIMNERKQARPSFLLGFSKNSAADLDLELT